MAKKVDSVLDQIVTTLLAEGYVYLADREASIRNASYPIHLTRPEKFFDVGIAAQQRSKSRGYVLSLDMRDGSGTLHAEYYPLFRPPYKSENVVAHLLSNVRNTYEHWKRSDILPR